MRADQFAKKERQLRAASEQATRRLGGHFAHPAARQSAGACLRSLPGAAERKNRWQLAGAAGLDTPGRFQHLLGRGAWDAGALRGGPLGEAPAGLGEGDAVLAVDGAGSAKPGRKSVGVKRQSCGAGGKAGHCQAGALFARGVDQGPSTPAGGRRA